MTIIQKGEPMSDLIDRQVAIDALAEQIALCDKALNTFGISMKDEYHNGLKDCQMDSGQGTE